MAEKKKRFDVKSAAGQPKSEQEVLARRERYTAKGGSS